MAKRFAREWLWYLVCAAVVLRGLLWFGIPIAFTHKNEDRVIVLAFACWYGFVLYFGCGVVRVIVWTIQTLRVRVKGHDAMSSKHLSESSASA
jgi:hypothetical protein